MLTLARRKEVEIFTTAGVVNGGCPPVLVDDGVRVVGKNCPSAVRQHSRRAFVLKASRVDHGAGAAFALEVDRASI